MTKRPPRAPRPQTTAPNVPPTVAAVAFFANLEGDPLSREFFDAWREMPDVIARILSGEEQHIPYGVIRDISGLEHVEDLIAQDKPIPPDANGFKDRFSHSLKMIHDADVDNVADFTTPIMSAGFYAGMAFALFVYTNGGTR